MSSLLRSGVTNINQGLVLSGDQSLLPTDTDIRKDHFLRLINEIVFSKPQQEVGTVYLAVELNLFSY